MADDSPSARSSTPTSGAPLRRVLTSEESAQFRQRPPTNRFSTSATEAPTPGVRRRSSNFSDYSLNEARRTFQSSTDDLLLPKPSVAGFEPSHETSHWHSAPLAFALLPAIGGMFFKNGSSIITDVMLLGLAAIFLNWSVRLPWDWYHSAQSLRKEEEYNADTVIDPESEDENALSFSQTTLDEVPEDAPAPEPAAKPVRRLPAHEAATKELYMHELLALLSCFLFPLLGAYLLHTIRSQLSRPSEGLVSNYNLTIFLLASELRPMAHLVKLIRSRTLHLQRIVNANPYNSVNQKGAGDIKDLARRLEDLEAKSSITETNSCGEPTLNGKQSAVITTEVRKTLQPDLDALNRAVRRYEKRATLQAFQTESRLLDLEARLNDAISLAAAAANNRQQWKSVNVISEWIATAIVLPLQAFGALASLPFKTLGALVNFSKMSLVRQKPPETKKKSANGKYPAHNRTGERLQSRTSKRL